MAAAFQRETGSAARRHARFVIGAALATWALAVLAQPISCDTWQECQTASVAALEAGEPELAHDLAWRAVQRGPSNHPQLMYLLARAQSLSGRPDDALVMLERLAGMGIPTDAEHNPDFARVRQLSRWPDVESRLRNAGATLASSVTAFTLAERDLVPDAFAYDEASDRFLFGSLAKRKISVYSPASGRSVDLVTAASAGFGAVTGLYIDRARGDLWAVSADIAGAGPGALHKIQLISGRPLDRIPAPTSGPHAFEDVAGAPNGAIYVVDSLADQVWRLAPGGRALQSFVSLPPRSHPRAIAIEPSGRVAFVACAEGITRVHLGSRAIAPVEAPGVSLMGIRELRWIENGVIALQTGLPGLNRVLYLPLDEAGIEGAARTVDVNVFGHLDPGALGVVGREAFYVANSQRSRLGSGVPFDPPVVRRLRLDGGGSVAASAVVNEAATDGRGKRGTRPVRQR